MLVVRRVVHGWIVVAVRIGVQLWWVQLSCYLTIFENSGHLKFKSQVPTAFVLPRKLGPVTSSEKSNRKLWWGENTDPANHEQTTVSKPIRQPSDSFDIKVQRLGCVAQ